MRFSVISLVLCVCVWAAIADVTHIKGVKSRILGRLTGKHHKRGILSGIPPFKLGHDIPVITHSVIKPLVVTYPPTASVAAVKIPVTGHHYPHYPVPVGHRVPGLPHPHYALKFPHHKFLTKPDNHFHHHHHHVAARPLVPVVPAPPVLPAPQVVHATAPVIPAPPPTVAVVHSAPPHPPPVPIFPAQLPVPAPPVPIIPNHLHVKPVLPAATVPLPPTPVLPSPLLPLNQAFPYFIRPGGAVQTSFFATYPRYPFLNSYQAPLYPIAPAVPGLPPPSPQVLLEQPHIHPYLVPQAAPAHGVVEHQAPNVVVEQTPHIHAAHLAPQPHVHLHPTQEAQSGFHLHTTQEAQPGFHFHPTQETQPGFHVHSQAIPQVPLQPTQTSVTVDHDGWSPVTPTQHDLATSHEAHYPQNPHFTQEQGNQVYEHHTEEQYHDYQHQLHHIQQQIEQAQYEQSLHNHQQQPAAEYGVPQQLGHEYQPNEYSQQGQDFAQQGHDFAHQASDFSQHGHDYSQQGQDFSQNGQDYNQNNFNIAQLGQEYGVPNQGVEGRSSQEDGADQQYHNHIPLGLQLPIDRPLDHFQ